MLRKIIAVFCILSVLTVVIGTPLVVIYTDITAADLPLTPNQSPSNEQTPDEPKPEEVVLVTDRPDRPSSTDYIKPTTTSHDVVVRNESLEVTTQVKLDSGNSRRFWWYGISFSETAEMESVSVANAKAGFDTLSVQRRGDQVYTKFNTKYQRESVVIEYRYTKPVSSNSWSYPEEGFYLSRFQLTGFNGHHTEVRIQAEGNMLTASALTNFEKNYTERPSPADSYGTDADSVVFHGTGDFVGVTSQANCGRCNSVVFTENYAVFGSEIPDKKQSLFEESYTLTQHTLGVKPDKDRIPVVILPKNQLQSRFQTPTAIGVHNYGVNYLAQSKIQQDKGLIAHETTHYFTYQFAPYAPRWWAEGVASYTEALMKESRGYDGSIFTNSDSFVDGGDYTDFTKRQSAIRDGEFTNYDYLYSELMIRQYIAQHGFENYQELLYQLRSRPITPSQTRAWDTTYFSNRGFSDPLDICSQQSSEETRSCLKRINQQSTLNPVSQTPEDELNTIYSNITFEPVYPE